MTDMELAELERVVNSLDTIVRRGAWQADPGLTACVMEFREIIAALRRGPERPPSGEMVMGLLGFVESGLLTNSRDIHDWRSDMESIRDVLIDWLSAAEAKGRKS